MSTVCWPHLGLGILVLLRATPLPPLPFLVNEESVEIVCHGGRRESPGSVKTRATFQPT